LKRKPLPPSIDGMPRLSKTKDGKQICYAYNNKGQTCVGSCTRSHVCWWCLEAHAGHKCPAYRDAIKNGAAPKPRLALKDRVDPSLKKEM
jgi:hypothetical protein